MHTTAASTLLHKYHIWILSRGQDFSHYFYLHTNFFKLLAQTQSRELVCCSIQNLSSVKLILKTSSSTPALNNHRHLHECFTWMKLSHRVGHKVILITWCEIKTRTNKLFTILFTHTGEKKNICNVLLTAFFFGWLNQN